MATTIPRTKEQRAAWAKQLIETANLICTPGKGILAADESTGTIGKRFAAINLDNNEENRSAYRKLLFTTKDLGNSISGAILYEETLFQSHDGVKMVDMLKKEGIVVGIKVDLGLTILPNSDDEHATVGLDGLDNRCKKYYAAGARFAKWRAVLKIDQKTGKPSNLSINETAWSLARYASICQVNNLVPIVEPEILTDGDHSIEVCAEVTERVLARVFYELHNHGILLEGCLLKPNMVTPGSAITKADANEIAHYTLRTLKRTVPPALRGICFLSGGQSEEDASLNLNAINYDNYGKLPWTLTFSYGRALQATVISTWKGLKDNEKSAQDALHARAQANGDAQLGKYKGGVASSGSLFQKGYVY